jgi:hypothetical protein
LRALIKIYARVTLIFVGPKSNFHSIANEIIGGRFMTAPPGSIQRVPLMKVGP